jgi:hypothetical protein
MDGEKKYIFPQETIDSLIELGEILRKINKRMTDEGYHIVGEKIVNIETGEEWNGDNFK